jgi:hypothetical protein
MQVEGGGEVAPRSWTRESRDYQSDRCRKQGVDVSDTPSFTSSETTDIENTFEAEGCNGAVINPGQNCQLKERALSTTQVRINCYTPPYESTYTMALSIVSTSILNSNTLSLLNFPVSQLFVELLTLPSEEK